MRRFRRLWAGQTISTFGSQVTLLALPTVAITALHAGAVQVGVLAALQYAAFPIFGLFVGVIVDRVAHRSIMLISDAIRAAALGLVPLLAALHRLNLWHLYVIAAVVGVASVFFDVAYQSYLPDIVTSDQLVAANTKLTTSNSVSQVAGPGVAGELIQIVGGAAAVGVDAVSFLVSAAFLWSAEPTSREPRAAAAATQIAEIRDGFRAIRDQPDVVRVMVSTAVSNLGTGVANAAMLLFLYDSLGLSPATVGSTFAIGALGLLAGAVATKRAVAVLGMRATLLASCCLLGVSYLVVANANNNHAVAVVITGLLLRSFATPIYNITQISLRQRSTPRAILGRVNATYRAVVWGAIPIGSLIGGFIASHWAPVTSLFVAGLVGTAACIATLGIHQAQALPTA